MFDVFRGQRAAGPRRVRPRVWISTLSLIVLGTASVLAQNVQDLFRLSAGFKGQIVVTGRFDDEIVGIDSGTLQILWRVPIAGTPGAIGSWGNFLFVGNLSTHNVEAYRIAGPKGDLKFAYILGEDGSMGQPTDLAVDEKLQEVFVLDSASKRVLVVSVKGALLRTIPGPGEPALMSPTAVAIDPDRQEVFVSDYGNPNPPYPDAWGPSVPARIVMYDYSGRYLDIIDGYKKFARPQGLDTDGMGHIFMAEANAGQVFVFDRTTRALVTKIGTFGDGPGQLQLPLDVTIDRESGDLFVTAAMLKRVVVFRGAAGGLP